MLSAIWHELLLCEDPLQNADACFWSHSGHVLGDFAWKSRWNPWLKASLQHAGAGGAAAHPSREQLRHSSGCQDPLLKLYFFIRSCLHLARICRHNIINSSAYFHKIYLFNTFSKLVNHSFFNVLLAAWKTGIYVTSSGPQTFSC